MLTDNTGVDMLSKAIFICLFAACNGQMLIPWWPLDNWSAGSNLTCPSVPESEIQCTLETNCPEDRQLKHSNITVPCQGAAGDDGEDADGVCCTIPTEVDVQLLDESDKPQTAAIVGGWNAPLRHWKFIVAIGQRKTFPDGSYWDTWHCGGSLFRTRFVLTAAHCVEYHQHYMIRLGEYDFRISGETMYQDIPADGAAIHPRYVPGKNHHDLAILRLKRPAKMTSSVQTINLEIDNRSLTGTTVQVAGWGMTRWEGKDQFHTLHNAEVMVISPESCEQSVNHEYSGMLDMYPGGLHPETKLCTNHFPGEQGSICHGDSGGPIISRPRNKAPILRGIVSAFSNPCLHLNIATRVGAYYSWIRNIIDNH